MLIFLVLVVVVLVVLVLVVAAGIVSGTIVLILVVVAEALALARGALVVALAMPVPMLVALAVLVPMLGRDLLGLTAAGTADSLARLAGCSRIVRMLGACVAALANRLVEHRRNTPPAHGPRHCILPIKNSNLLG
jgi:hypothetical protein